MKTIKRKSSTKRPTPYIILATASLVVLMGAIGAWAFYANSNTPQTDTPQQGSTPSTDTDAPDSTETTQKSDTANSATPKEPSTTIGIVIVDASQYDDVFEVRAYAEAIEPGLCTFTFTSDSQTITKQVTASSGPSTASCDTLDLPVNQLSKGAWDLTINYTSNSKNYTGSSKTSITIE